MLAAFRVYRLYIVFYMIRFNVNKPISKCIHKFYMHIHYHRQKH